MWSRRCPSRASSASAGAGEAVARRDPLPAGLTVRGRSLLAGGAATLICAAVLHEINLARIGVFLVVLPLLAYGMVARTRYRLTCTRRLEPVRVPAGDPARVVLRLQNVSRMPTGVMLAEDTVPYMLGGRPRFVLDRVVPQRSVDVEYTVRSQLRGRFRVGPLTVRVTDPFGLCEVGRSFSSSDVLVVTPQVVRLPDTRLGGDWVGAGESRARSVATSGEDDVTTREYRQGDDLRRVHWRSTARRGELMVRREEQPWQSRATLLLDRRRAAHRGDGPESSFEWAVSAIASVAVHLASRGYAVRMVDGTQGQESANPWAHIASAGGEQTSSAVLDTLATVSAGGEIELQRAVHAAARAATGGLVVAALGE